MTLIRAASRRFPNVTVDSPACTATLLRSATFTDHGVWVAASNTEIWFIEDGFGVITRLRLSDLVQLGTFTHPNSPGGICFDSLTGDLWALGDPTDISGHGSANRLNKDNGTLNLTIPMPQEGGLYQIDLLTHDGANLRGSGNGSSLLYEFDPSDGTVLGTVPLSNFDSEWQVRHDNARNGFWYIGAGNTIIELVDDATFAFICSIEIVETWNDFAVTPDGQHLVTVDTRGFPEFDCVISVYALSG